MAQHPLSDRRRPYVMAHRGASDLAPENTLAAFGLAVEAGADLIETDLWFTRDGELVCHHDATVTRMTGAAGAIPELTRSEVQALPIRSRFDEQFPDERIPTLAEALDRLPPEVVLVVELKDPRFADPRWAEQLARQAAARVAARSIIAISFHWRCLQGLRTAAPDFPLGYISLHNPFPTRPVDVFGPYWPLLLANPAYVAWAHRRGKWVCPLDPGLHKRLAWYLRLGVDAVLTNHPAATRARIEHLRGRVTTKAPRSP